MGKSVGGWENGVVRNEGWCLPQLFPFLIKTVFFSLCLLPVYAFRVLRLVIRKIRSEENSNKWDSTHFLLNLNGEVNVNSVCFSCRSANAAISVNSGYPASDASGGAHACSHIANTGSGQNRLCCCTGNSISCSYHDTAEFHPWWWCKFLHDRKTLGVKLVKGAFDVFCDLNHQCIWFQSAVIQLVQQVQFWYF